MTSDTTTYAGFEIVATMRREVVDLIRRQIAVISSMEGEAQHERWLERLAELASMVETDSFKVIILGQFSRGKSTIINALLGQNVLPSYATETTAIINAVKFGKEPRAQVYPRPTPDEAFPAPIEVDVNQLEAYIRVDDEDDEDGRLNPYTRADVFWPIELCRNGVELIDSPGLDSVNVAREEETLAYLSKVDAVVMVLDAQQAAGRSELEFFTEFVRPLGHEDVFWVVNKINLVGDDRQRVIDKTHRVLAPYISHEDRVFFVNALGALQAKESHDAAGLPASGMPELEENLQQFLTLQRGRAKVLVPVRQVQQSIREVREAIRTGEQLLGEAIETLSARAYDAERPLGAMEKTVKYLSEGLERKTADLVRTVGLLTERHVTELIERVPQIVDGLTPESRLSLNPRLIRSSAGALGEELAHGARNAIQHDLVTWRTVDVANLVRDQLTAIQHEIRDDVRDFEQSLKDVRLNLMASSPAEVDADSLDVALESSSVQGYGAGAGTDLALVGAGKALTTAFAGGAGAFAGFVAVSVLGLSAIAPFVIIGAAVWAAWNVASDGDPRRSLEGKIRRRLAAGLKTSLTDNKEAIVAQTVVDIEALLTTITQEFRSLLTSKVESLREEVQGALAAKRTGEEEVRSRRAQIKGQLTELDAINRSLDAIVDRVIALDEEFRASSDAGVPDPYAGSL